MKMNQQLNELKSFTVEEFQADFDNLMEKVENGESFIIHDENNSAVIVPYNGIIKYTIKSIVDDDLIRIYTDHDEAS